MLQARQWSTVEVSGAPAHRAVGVSLENAMARKFLQRGWLLAGSTGLEPAASGVTGRRSSQLNYDP